MIRNTIPQRYVIMRICMNFVIPASILASALAGPALAQGQPIALTGDVKVVRLVTGEDGQTRTELSAPTTTVPGDRLLFGTSYANSGAEPVERFVMTNPLPSAVRLAPDADPALTVSVDGGRSWGRLDELTVTATDGALRAAEAGDVTHIRWTLAVVNPGESGRLEYPAIIR